MRSLPLFRRGFTLVELLVTIAFMSVIIGLLLPTIQRIRNSVFASIAEAEGGFLCEELLGDLNVSTINEQYIALQNLTTDSIGSWRGYRQDVLTGKWWESHDNYEFFYVKDHAKIEAHLTILESISPEGAVFAERLRSRNRTWPLLIFRSPYIDADYEWVDFHHIYVDTLTCEQISVYMPISEFSRPHPELVLTANIAALIVEGDAPEETARGLKQFASHPNVVPVAAAVVDANADSTITVAEFSSFMRRLADQPINEDSTAVEFFTQRTSQYVVDRYHFTEADDSIHVGVDIDELTGDPTRLFSYDALCRLTQAFVEQPGKANSICRKLENARFAEQAGRLHTRDNVLTAAQHQLDAMSGQELSYSAAEQLRILTEVQKAEYRGTE